MRSRLLLTSLLLTLGCANTSFYSDPELKKKTGFRFYTPRPYLLVARTGGPEKPFEISVVYLPDLENPQFAKPDAGWGSSEFSLTIGPNGSVSAVGGKNNAMVPETISALGTLLGSSGDLLKAISEAKITKGEPLRPVEPVFELYEIRQEGGKTLLRRVLPEP